MNWMIVNTDLDLDLDLGEILKGTVEMEKHVFCKSKLSFDLSGLC